MLSATFRKVRQNKLRTAALIVVGIIFIIGLEDFFLGTHQLSAYDNGWDDLSRFRASLELNGYRTSSIVSTPLILNASEGVPAVGRVLVVIGVERPYLPAEMSNIVDFVAAGGCLLLADDFGYGNTLADKFGAGFSGRRLFSSAFDRNPAFPRLNGTIDQSTYSLIADRPTALEKVTERTVRAWTDPDTWQDENRNGERDIVEESNPYPVVAVLDRSYWSGDRSDWGTVIVVSDPGLFIDDMWGRGDNSRFVINCAKRFLPGAEEFIFDETRHKPETIREGAWRTGMMLEVLALDNLLGKVALALIALLALIVGALKVKPPAEWHHEDTLSELSLLHTADHKYRSEDRARLRSAFLEKVRISLNLYLDEFVQLDKERLREVIGDEELARLVEQPGSVRLTELDGLTDRVSEWRRR